MKKHSWKIEAIDGGYMGIGYFWVCHYCGASGGPDIFNKPPPVLPPFYVGTSHLKLSYDCNEAKKQIQEYLENKAK